MKLTEFDYNLPSQLIAQHPVDKREDAKMMVIHRETDKVEHRHFYDVREYLKEGDCLILNDSKVIPARLFGRKEGTGAKIEVLMVRRLEGDLWEAMVRPGKRLKEGDIISFSQEPLFKAQVIGAGQDTTRQVRFIYQGIFNELLDQFGQIPLPPYIDRQNEVADRERYQTVYCQYEGSIAAPTAGLHFTKELLTELQKKGVEVGFVTLHVGIGTFRPVQTEKIIDHIMHFEEYAIDEKTAGMINRAKQEGRRVIAVGTTSIRTLESAADESGWVIPGQRSTNLFIYPPSYTFKVADALITNFHLPKSTLLMLVSAFYETDKILNIYHCAVEKEYRFFSYGDCMFII